MLLNEISNLRNADPETLLNTDELCRVLGKSKSWAERHRWAGTGLRFYRIGQTPYYRAADVVRFIDDSRVETR
jgi:hypothetical protein